MFDIGNGILIAPAIETVFLLMSEQSKTFLPEGVKFYACNFRRTPMNKCSPPRKEKYSKTSTGKYVVPQELIIIVNPNRGKQGEIPERESPGIANPKGYPSWRKKEFIPRCHWDNYNKDLRWCQKEFIPRRQRKQRGIPEEESPGIFIPKGDPSWHQKEVILRC